MHSLDAERSARKLSDRKWFAKYRRRSHRLRPQIPHEFPDYAPGTLPGFVEYVVVKQIEPGRRMRRPARLHFKSPEDEARFAANDRACGLLFDALKDLRNCAFSLDDILAHAEREHSDTGARKAQ